MANRKERAGAPRGLLLFLAVMGPGIITANIDNDAGGIAVYSLAGAQFGFSLIWTLVPIMVALIIIQEMSARLGVITGKGLADLIRENYGVKAAFYVVVGLLIVNIASTAANLAGVAGGLEIFGVSPYISVPLGSLFVWSLVVHGSYKSVEKVFLTACLFYLSYIISGLIARPDWAEITTGLVPSIKADNAYLLMLIGLVGTSITPWMQFYLQSAVVEKGIKPEQYRFSRLDVLSGSITMVVVALFIILACAATLFKAGISIKDASDAAVALGPLAGKYASYLFAFGLLNASLFASSVIPLSTAYSVCEGMGWEAGVNKRLKEAPHFFIVYTMSVALAAGLVLIPGAPLLAIMFYSQVANGITLPFVLIFMLLLINNKEIMGNHTNSKGYNIIAWGTCFVMVALTLTLVVSSLVL